MWYLIVLILDLCTLTYFKCWISFAPVFSRMYCYLYASFLYFDFYLYRCIYKLGIFLVSQTCTFLELRVRLAQLYMFKPSGDYLLTLPRWSFCGSLNGVFLHLRNLLTHTLLFWYFLENLNIEFKNIFEYMYIKTIFPLTHDHFQRQLTQNL